MITYYKYDTYVGDYITFALPRRWKADGSKPAVIISPTTTENRLFPFDSNVGQPVLKALTDEGFPVACITPLNEWGNSRSRGWITRAKNILQNEHGAKAGKVGLVGLSQGAANVLSWTAANQNLAGYVGAYIPATDINKVAEMPVFQSSVQEAYPEGNYNNPLDFALAGDYGNIKVDIIYASDDNIVQKAWLDEFAEASGSELINGGNFGHTWNIIKDSDNLDHLINNLKQI